MQLISDQELTRRLKDMTEVELIAFQLRLMDCILEKKVKEGKIVFSEVENGLLN